MAANPKPEGSWPHVAGNLDTVRAALREAAERAGRDPADVQLVAVSKGMPAAAVRAAIAAGHMTFGENRVQEALPKMAELADAGARWHLVGHLQHNKAKAATAFDIMESVDSTRIAVALDSHLASPRTVYLEVNVAGEASKSGFRPAELAAALEAIRALAHLHVEGLMTIAPLVAEAEEVRPVFRELRRLRDAHGLQGLSMGMTNDFPVAIAEGATIVRVGRAIFGDR